MKVTKMIKTNLAVRKKMRMSIRGNGSLERKRWKLSGCGTSKESDMERRDQQVSILCLAIVEGENSLES